MKKILFVGMVLLYIFSCIFIFMSCKKGSIEFNVAYRSRQLFSFAKDDEGQWDKMYTGTKLLFNFTELKDMCEEYDNPAFDSQAEGYDSALSLKLREYDDVYFEEKALVIYSGYSWNDSRKPKVKWITVNDTILTIVIGLKNDWRVHTTEAVSILFLIEVNKSDVQGVTDIRVETKE